MSSAVRKSSRIHIKVLAVKNVTQIKRTGKIKAPSQTSSNFKEEELRDSSTQAGKVREKRMDKGKYRERNSKIEDGRVQVKLQSVERKRVGFCSRGALQNESPSLY